jgi:exosortase A-associated hydrolase 2
MTPESSGYFTGPSGQLHATFHAPHAVALAPARCVLVLPPFGEERKCASRLTVRASRALARAGVGVMRFDYSGTGESLGDHAAVTVADWIADSAAAADCLRRHQPDAELAVLGLRLGANLALRCPALATAPLVLWEPLLTGEAYLQEMIRRKQIKEMKSAGAARSTDAELNAVWARGEAVDFDGFPVGAGFADDLRALELAADLQPDRASAILLIHVSGSRRLPAGWSTAKERCEAGGGTFQLIADKPFWGRLEDSEAAELLTATTTFLRPAADAIEPTGTTP